MDQRAAIITGGNSGIGEAVVRRLASRGWRVALAGRRAAENDRVAALARADGAAEVLPLALDLSREEDCRTLVGTAREAFGRIDLVLNNAGKINRSRVADSTTEEWEDLLRTNLSSVYWCSREAYRVLREQEIGPEGVRGAILQMSSVCGVDAWAGTGLYSATKHGMMGLTRAMADEGAEDLIRVCALCPALVATPLSGASGPEAIQPEDLAETVDYLLRLSPAAWPTEIVVPRRGAD